MYQKSRLILEALRVLVEQRHALARAVRAATATCLLLVVLGPAPASAEDSFRIRVSANQLYQVCTEPIPFDDSYTSHTVVFCAAYLNAILDSATTMEATDLISCDVAHSGESALPIEQIRLMFRRAYEQHPELGHLPAASFIIGYALKCSRTVGTPPA